VERLCPDASGLEVGIRSGQSRSAALFQLATDLPAAVLARLLGIHITVAVAWQRARAGDWAAYAAMVSRRSIRGKSKSRQLTPAHDPTPQQSAPGLAARSG
jgi:hypothetical protein